MRRLAFALILGLSAVASAEPPTTHEVIYARPSGFWTSNRPAVGGAYRYRMLLIGLGASLLTGILTWRMVKRVNRDRAAKFR